MRKCAFILFLCVLLQGVFAGQIIKFPDLEKPAGIHIAGDEIIIVDGCTIKIYSAATYKLKNKFGSKGEGPGEFRWSPAVTVLPDHFFMNHFDRIYWFSRQGELIKEKKKSPKNHFIPFVDGNFIVKEDKNTNEQGKITRTIAIYDSKLERIKESYKTDLDMSSRVVSPAFNNKSYKHHMIEPFRGTACDRESGKFFVADSRKGCYFDVFDKKGNTLYAIHKEVEKIKVSEAYKKRRFENFKKWAGPMWEALNKRTYVFPEFFPAIFDFRVSGGMIYIATYNREDNKSEFIVLDQKGKIIKKVFIPAAVEDTYIPRFTIANGKFYQIVDNEKTQSWQLHIHDIK